MIGETMFVTGACMFLTAPIAGSLMRMLDPRVMLVMGFTGFGFGTWILSGITKDWDFWELLVPQILRGVSLDDVHGPDHQHRARHAAAGADEERLGPVQPDPQPRRRRRPRASSTPSSTTARTCICSACARASPGAATSPSRPMARSRRALRPSAPMPRRWRPDGSPRWCGARRWCSASATSS